MMELKLKHRDEKKSETVEKPKFPRILYLLLAISLVLLLTLVVFEEIESPRGYFAGWKIANEAPDANSTSQHLRPNQSEVSENHHHHHQNKKPLVAMENLATGPKKKLPEVIMIGVRQGGFELLWKIFQEHPQMKIVQKETKFFEHDKLYHKGLDWYRNVMPETLESELTIDVAPDTFINEKAMHRMMMKIPSLKLILTVKEPVHRLQSDYTRHSFLKHLPSHEVKHGKEELGKYFHFQEAVNTGLYSFYYRRWLQYFKKEQILIVPYERLIKEPLKEMTKIEQFLGINVSNSKDVTEAAAANLIKVQHGFHHENKKIVDMVKRQHNFANFRRTHWAFKFLYRPYIFEFMKLTGDQFYRSWL